MEHPSTQHLRFAIDDASSVSALLRVPTDAWAGYVFAHGAGAGLEHAFLAACACGLAERGIASLRYQFPYMEQGSKRPDAPKTAHAAVRAAVAETAQRLAGLPLFAGGKSFGGRMTSQAQAVQPLVHRLGERATLALFDDADHAFHVRARSGRTDAQTLGALLDATASWMRVELEHVPAMR